MFKIVNGVRRLGGRVYYFNTTRLFRGQTRASLCVSFPPSVAPPTTLAAHNPKKDQRKRQAKGKATLSFLRTP